MAVKLLKTCVNCGKQYEPFRCRCGTSFMMHETFSSHSIGTHNCEPWIRDLLIRGGR